MTWEETIKYARTQDQFHQLIHDAYLDENLKKNCERFIQSIEFSETLKLLRTFIKNKSTSLQLLDIGAGNGISSVAFAKQNFQVSSIEPDQSDSLGSKAIEWLKVNYRLSNLNVYSAFGESLPFENEHFDVVYARQTMHHANDLYQFIREASRVLKKGGVLMTTRDHVVNDAEQKKEFLENHPFQTYYHGENAYSFREYSQAFKKAGLTLVKTLGPLDSAINYSPKTKQELAEEFRNILKSKFRLRFWRSNWIDDVIIKVFNRRTNNMNSVAGRLYTFIAIKP